MKRMDIISALELAKALRDVVRAAGLTGCPSGHLYAACMSRLSLETYESCMRMLERAGVVVKRGDVYFAGVTS